MINDILAIVHDVEACGPVSRLIECVLVFPIDPDVAKRDPGDLLQFPADAAPVDASDNDRKIFVVRLFVKELGEHFFGGTAVLPTRTAANAGSRRGRRAAGYGPR